MKTVVATSEDDLRDRVVQALGRSGRKVFGTSSLSGLLSEMARNRDTDFFIVDWHLVPNGGYAAVNLIKQRYPQADIWVTSQTPLTPSEKDLFDGLDVSAFYLAIELPDQLRRRELIR